MVAAEGAAPRVELAEQQLVHEPWVRRIDPERFPPQNTDVEGQVRNIGPEGDKHPVGGRGHLAATGVRPDGIGAVGVGGEVEATGPQAEHAGQEHNATNRHGCSHGQKPRSKPKKKLLLGGKGATSTFRTIA